MPSNLTPNSSLTSYVTPAEFLLRRDVRVAGDLVNDSNVQQTPAQLATNQSLAVILLECSGIFEAAAVAGERYLPEDIQALIAYGGAGAEYIKGIICSLAAYKLTLRRWVINTNVQKDYEQALEVLKMLRDGEVVLPFIESEQAGLTDTKMYTQQEIAALYLSTSKARIYGNTRVQDRIGYPTYGGG